MTELVLIFGTLTISVLVGLAFSFMAVHIALRGKTN